MCSRRRRAASATAQLLSGEGTCFGMTLPTVKKADGVAFSAAGAGTRPELQAYAGYGIERDFMSDDLLDYNDGWRAGLRLSWDFFDGSATRGRVRQTAADLRLARLDLDQARLNIDVEVRRAHASVVEATELVKATGKVVEQAEESLRMARARYNAGVATQLDVDALHPTREIDRGPGGQAAS